MGKKTKYNGLNAPEIDWEKIEAAHEGKVPSNDKPQTSNLKNTRRRRPNVNFARLVTGFNEETLDYLSGLGIEGLRINPNTVKGIEANFYGRSKKPTEHIPLKRPGAVRTESGLIVITSRVDGNFIEEIGNQESGAVKRTDEPDMNGMYGSRNIFNLALSSPDTELSGRNFERISDLIKGCGGLALTPVVSEEGFKTEWARRHFNPWRA